MEQHGKVIQKRVRWSVAVLTIALMIMGAAAAHPYQRSIPAGDCGVALSGTGRFRLNLAVGPSRAIASFEWLGAPQFGNIQLLKGQYSDCDQPVMGATPTHSPGTGAIARHAAAAFYTGATARWQRTTSPATEYAYRDMARLADPLRDDGPLGDLEKALSEIATQLMVGHAGAHGALTQSGGLWASEMAVKTMMEGYVAGREPAAMVAAAVDAAQQHLEGETGSFQGSADDLHAELEARYRTIAADVLHALADPRPDPQSVSVSTMGADSSCTHSLTITSTLHGGRYQGVFSVDCGSQAGRWISAVDGTDPVVEPGQAGAVVAQAFDQYHNPMPLSAALSHGIAPVRVDGSGEPNAVLGAAKATFNFVAALPRRQGVYPVTLALASDKATGLLRGDGRGTITVVNVAPEMERADPPGTIAAPGQLMVLRDVTLHLLDPNADSHNADELKATAITLAHPAGLNTTPRFDHADNARRSSFNPATGQYVFDFARAGTVARPHMHGTWPLVITVADDSGLTATASLQLVVRDVPPRVVTSSVQASHVHHDGNQLIQVKARLSDDNGADDLVGVVIDARDAGGGVYSLRSGLVKTNSGPDWIDVQLARPFLQTHVIGAHPIPIVVRDSAHTVPGSDTLYVGDSPPEITGYGYLQGPDTVPTAGWKGHLLPTAPSRLCPNTPFPAGVTASDAEKDSVDVVGIIVETGERVPFHNTSPAVYIGNMKAPPKPGHYTLRFIVTQRKPVKADTVETGLDVPPCQDQDRRTALLSAEPVTPQDVADAPRDQTSQAFVADVAGQVVEPVNVSGAGESSGGPRIADLFDSLDALLPVAPAPSGAAAPVEMYLLARGGSTGPVVQLFAINGSGQPLQLDPRAVILEPVAITPAIQSRVTGSLQQFVAAGGAVTTVNAYCLELLRQPPAAGTLLRIAGADVAAPFAKYRTLLDAARRLRDGGLLHPDSDPLEYFHAMRQWSIWTVAQHFNERQFTDEFVKLTRHNVEATGQGWSSDMEAGVRKLAPNRWSDVQQVIREAGLGSN